MLVSICMPVYNMAATIQRAIMSALNQDYQEIEVIVADNQSTDDTYKLASSITHKNLKVFRNETNSGAYGNHNRCLELARGEWIKFLHGDDELLPHCVSSMVSILKTCPDNIGLIGCGTIERDQQEKEIARSYVPSEPFLMRAANVKEFMLEGNIFGTPTMVMLHRQKLMTIGGFDLTMEPASDGDCWINLRSHFPSAIVPEHLVITRDDPPGDINQRINHVMKFCKQIFLQIDKWHRLDKEVSSLPIKDTPYGDWIKQETFRFWDSGFRNMLAGRADVLLLLSKQLIDRNMLISSLGYYLQKRMKLSGAHSFRNKPWDIALSSLRIR